MIKRVSIIGSGNVASHIAPALLKAGIRLDSIYSRKLEKADQLALKVGAKGINKLKDLSTQSDLYLLCVPDDIIGSLAESVSKYVPKQAIMAHSSGSKSLQTLAKWTENAGVFYPLQTFSKKRELDLSDVPFFISGTHETVENELLSLAKKISSRVKVISDEQRKILHIAAVFSCNFSNYLYHISDELLSEHELDFEDLRPLIMETASKVMDQKAREMQTGPALRNDSSTMKSHLAMLKEKKRWKKLYKLLSKGIAKDIRSKEL